MKNCTPTCGGYAVELANPIDAEGKPIPLDTTMLYDRAGRSILVKEFKFKINTSTGVTSWVAVGAYEGADEWITLLPGTFFITQPDSWEKLEEDLDRCADAPDYEECAYFGKDESSCSSCVAGKEASCSKTAMRDIASRIRKLRGEDDA